MEDLCVCVVIVINFSDEDACALQFFYVKGGRATQGNFGTSAVCCKTGGS